MPKKSKRRLRKTPTHSPPKAPPLPQSKKPRRTPLATQLDSAFHSRLSTNNPTSQPSLALSVQTLPPPHRERLPDTRLAETHKFNVGGYKGYLIVGFYPDHRVGELFITMQKEGSTIGGLMDTIGTLVSIALQSGVTLETLVAKFSHTRFEPSGSTTNSSLPTATSVIDYIFRWLELRYITPTNAIKTTSPPS